VIITCLKYRAIDTGSFCGFVDLYIHDLDIEVYGCTLYKKDDKRWLNLPVRPYQNSQGEEKYTHILRFRDQAKFREFCTTAKAAVDKYVTEEQNDG